MVLLLQFLTMMAIVMLITIMFIGVLVFLCLFLEMLIIGPVLLCLLIPVISLNCYWYCYDHYSLCLDCLCFTATLTMMLTITVPITIIVASTSTITSIIVLTSLIHTTVRVINPYYHCDDPCFFAVILILLPLIALLVFFLSPSHLRVPVDRALG